MPFSDSFLTSRPFSDSFFTALEPTLFALIASALPPSARNTATHDITFAKVSRSLIAHRA